MPRKNNAEEEQYTGKTAFIGESRGLQAPEKSSKKMRGALAPGPDRALIRRNLVILAP